MPIAWSEDLHIMIAQASAESTQGRIWWSFTATQSQDLCLPAFSAQAKKNARWRIFRWLRILLLAIVLAMETTMATINGRKERVDIEPIRRLLADHPLWGRARVSRELCARWDWRAANGDLKDMACRNLLLRLERGGWIELPARQRRSANAFRRTGSDLEKRKITVKQL